MIELRQVTRRYAGDPPVVAVRAVDLDIVAGELVALVGESGSGKTTLLKMINRLIDPDQGTVRVGGVNVRTRPPALLRREIGYVIQQGGLFPHLSVAENVGVVPRLLGWPAAEIAARVDELLAMVELDPARYRDRDPAALSGGQRQRVGVARALAARPKVLLLDEPFGALDPITRDGLQEELRRIHRELALTTVIVTHDLAEALTLADRVAIVRGGEIRQIDTPSALWAAPADDYVAQLLDMARRQVARLSALVTAAPGPTASGPA
jgi:osmoprotectant transport system ATP-binding protein